MISLIPDDAIGIAVKLSGGADSAIIYYNLCKQLYQRKLDIPIYVVTLDTGTKYWYSHYARKVIRFVEQEFGISPREHIINKIGDSFTEEEYVNGQDQPITNLIKHGLVNVKLDGLTQNPNPTEMYAAVTGHPELRFNSDDDLKNWCMNAFDPDRSDHSHKRVTGIDSSDDNISYKFIYPFMHSHKRYVAEEYKQANVMDSLFPLTYSCEDPENSHKIPLDVVDNLREYSHCGQCWFCAERLYGFNRLV
jgi:hypothetical protein